MKVHGVRIPNIMANLSDDPDEEIAVALADAIFDLEEADGRRFEFCLQEADIVRSRLKRHGFDVVRVSVVKNLKLTI